MHYHTKHSRQHRTLTSSSSLSSSLPSSASISSSSLSSSPSESTTTLAKSVLSLITSISPSVRDLAWCSASLRYFPNKVEELVHRRHLLVCKPQHTHWSVECTAHEKHIHPERVCQQHCGNALKGPQFLELGGGHSCLQSWLQTKDTQ